MELFNLKHGVLGLLALVGIALSGVVFSSLQDDSKVLQEMLVAQKGNDVKLTTIVEDLKERGEKLDDIVVEQHKLDRRIYTLELLAQMQAAAAEPEG